MRGSPHIRFTRRDAATVALLLLLTAALSVTCWYAASRSRQRLTAQAHQGVVTSRSIVMPPGKQMVPVRYTVTLREASGDIVIVDVPYGIYRLVRVGSIVRRERSGAVMIVRAK